MEPRHRRYGSGVFFGLHSLEVGLNPSEPTKTHFGFTLFFVDVVGLECWTHQTHFTSRFFFYRGRARNSDINMPG
jgi:hypothetical protein